MFCHCFSRRFFTGEFCVVWALTLLVCTSSMAQGYFPGVNSQTGVAQPNYVPPGSLPPEAYRLGIGARNTDTGLQITDVTPNSIARRSGLEAGDRIVTVAGQQVGYLAGKLIDLTNELARNVDSQGRVTLLVHDQRTRQLVNVPVQFSMAMPTSQSVSGRIGTQSAYRATSTSALSVRLLDVTYPQWTDIVVAEQTIPSPQQFPTGYRLQVSPRNVKPDHRYAVSAQLTDRGYVTLKTPVPVPVVLSEQGTRMDLVLQSTGNQLPGEVTPYEQITKVFLDLLGRQPTNREMATWQQHLDRGGSISDVRIAILSSSEFYDRYYNDPQQYLAGVYLTLFGVPPSPQQRQELTQRLLREGGIRHRVVEELVEQSGG
jgi:uncharacterized lipoprotein YbaY